MSDLGEAIRDFTALFERLQIPYAIIGGVAARVYGITRPTYDFDVTLACPRERLPELYDAVRESGYTVPEAYERGWVDYVAKMPMVKFRLYLQNRGVDIDVFLGETEFQLQFLARRRHGNVDGIPVWLATPEDVILLKLLSSRLRDLSDIDDVRFMRKDLDVTYMRKWADHLGIRDKLETTLARPPRV